VTTARGKFGPKLRELRVSRNLTLREFCDRAKVDAGNYSKIERGLFAPPGADKIEQYLKPLGIEVGSDEYVELIDLAAIDRGELPRRLLSDEQVLAELPVLFSVLGGEAVSEDRLDKLIELIRHRGNPSE